MLCGRELHILRKTFKGRPGRGGDRGLQGFTVTVLSGQPQTHCSGRGGPAGETPTSTPLRAFKLYSPSVVLTEGWDSSVTVSACRDTYQPVPLLPYHLGCTSSTWLLHMCI